MQRVPPPESPDAYVTALSGWRRERVETLRAAVLSAGGVEERIKWRHLVYFANGPVCLIRAEEHRVLYGFWRGQRLREVEPRLKPGGKYEMATLELREDTPLDPEIAAAVARAGITLNREVGDPTKASSPRT